MYNYSSNVSGPISKLWQLHSQCSVEKHLQVFISAANRIPNCPPLVCIPIIEYPGIARVGVVMFLCLKVIFKHPILFHTIESISSRYSDRHFTYIAYDFSRFDGIAIYKEHSKVLIFILQV